MFDLFDEEQTGVVKESDVVAMTISLRKDANIVHEVMAKIKKIRKPEQEKLLGNDKVSFGEFAALMW